MGNILKLIALVVALFFVLMFFFKIYAKEKVRRMEGKEMKHLEDGMIYFYSEGCGACRMMRPEVEKVKERLKVMEVDVGTSEGLKLAKELGVMATPTTLLVKDGIIKKAFVGFVKHEKILKEV
ncbi:MAG: thioredoxin family protein [Aquificaceae bacterium]